MIDAIRAWIADALVRAAKRVDVLALVDHEAESYRAGLEAGDAMASQRWAKLSAQQMRERDALVFELDGYRLAHRARLSNGWRSISDLLTAHERLASTLMTGDVLKDAERWRKARANGLALYARYQPVVCLRLANADAAVDAL